MLPASQSHAAFRARRVFQQNRDGTCHRDDVEPSLNAAMSCRKDCNGSNLGEQIHQVRDRPRIDQLHGLAEPASEIVIGEGFTQPMELLHSPVPGHRVRQPPLPAELLFHQDPVVFGVDGDSGIELSGITSGEMVIGTDLHACEQRLCIRRLYACRLQWCGPDLVVEQGRRDKIFQVVIGLVFDAR